MDNWIGNWMRREIVCTINREVQKRKSKPDQEPVADYTPIHPPREQW